MILLAAWVLIVLFFYCSSRVWYADYVINLIQNHGTFTLWHAYSLKAFWGLVIASWITWIAIKYGGRLLLRVAPGASLSTLERLVFSAGLGFGLISSLTFAFGV